MKTADPFQVGHDTHHLCDEDWRDVLGDEAEDDEELSESPSDVVAILGFDPLELSEDEITEPIRYAAGESSSSKWIPFTGPRGGKGWQNVETLEVVYGEDRPGDGREPKADEPSEPAKPQELPLTGEPTEFKWIEGTSRGKKAWQHPKTGEVVIGEQPPSHDKAKEIIEKAKTPAKKPPKPAAPAPEQPAAKQPEQPKEMPKSISPQKSPLLKQIEALPEGTELFGWKKENIMGSALWKRGSIVLSDRQFVDKHAEQLQQGIPEVQAPTEPTAAGEKPAPKGKQPPRDFTPDEKTIVNSASGIFGAAPGDIGNDRQMRKFLIRTARNLGLDPDSVQGDSADKAIAAAKYLAGEKPKLDAIIWMAKQYGYGGGSARELAGTARHAGLHLIQEAVKRGHTLEGSTEQEKLASAISFLAQHEQGQQQPGATDMNQAVTQAIHALTNHFRGPVTGRHIALAVAGFFLGYMAVRQFKRSRRIRRSIFGGR